MKEIIPTKQLVTESTRITNKISNLIDHMYVTNPDKIRTAKVTTKTYYLCLSDAAQTGIGNRIYL